MKYTKITISGKICTGKTTLYKSLQDKLKWSVFSTGQYFREYAKKHTLSLEKADEQNEKITKQVDYKVRDLLKKDKHIIAEGWMTGIMADAYPSILKILLVCDDKTRISRFAQREHIDISEAEKRIKERENNVFNKLKQIYSRNDFLDKKNYNLIIDTTHITPQKILQRVISRL